MIRSITSDIASRQVLGFYYELSCICTRNTVIMSLFITIGFIVAALTVGVDYSLDMQNSTILQQ